MTCYFFLLTVVKDLEYVERNQERAKKNNNNELNLVLFLSLSIKRKSYGNCFQEQAF